MRSAKLVPFHDSFLKYGIFSSLILWKYGFSPVGFINMHFFCWKSIKFELFFATGCINMQIWTKLEPFRKFNLKYVIFLLSVLWKKAITLPKIGKTHSFVTIFWQLNFLSMWYLFMCVCDWLHEYMIVPEIG